MGGSPAESLDVVSTYSRVAFVYDLWTRLTETRSLGVALDRAAIRDGEAVLEVAVGTGIAFEEILRRNPTGRNVGIDLTEGMLRRARRRAARSGIACTLELGDARSLPFPDASFDLVMNNNMLGLVPAGDLMIILRELHRVLRPGGRLVLVMMTRPRSLLGGWIYRVGAVWLGGWRDVEVESLVRAAGFEGVRCQVVTQVGIPSQVFDARKGTDCASTNEAS